MKLPLSTLDADTVEILRMEATDREAAHKRNQYRDEIIVALETATGETFTFGRWEDNAYHELEDGKVTTTLVNPNNSAECLLVSETRQFMLRVSDLDDDLSGLDDQGTHRLFDINTLLERSELVGLHY